LVGIKQSQTLKAMIISLGLEHVY